MTTTLLWHHPRVILSSSKTAGYDRPRHPVLQILWGIEELSYRLTWKEEISSSGYPECPIHQTYHSSLRARTTYLKDPVPSYYSHDEQLFFGPSMLSGDERKQSQKSSLQLVDEVEDEGAPEMEPRFDDEEADMQKAMEESLKDAYPAQAQEEGRLTKPDAQRTKGQAGSNPGDAAVDQPQSSHVENLKLPTDDQVILEEPEDEPDKTNTESEVQSMVTVPIHQDTSFVPLMTSPIIDLTVSQPASLMIHAPIQTSTTTTIATTTTSLPPPPPQPQQSTADLIIINRIACIIQTNLHRSERKLALKKERTLQLKNTNLGSTITSHSLLTLAGGSGASCHFWIGSDDSISDEKVNLFDDEDSGNNHSPKADSRKDWSGTITEGDKACNLEPIGLFLLDNILVIASSEQRPRLTRDLEGHGLLKFSNRSTQMSFTFSLMERSVTSCLTDRSSNHPNSILLQQRLGVLEIRHDATSRQKEHTIAEKDFKNLYPSDFEDLNILLLQGHLDHLPGSDKRMLSTAVKLWTRNLVIHQQVEDFQLGIESYQKQLNLTKPGWDATGYEFKHDYTIIESPQAVVFPVNSKE
ncbi:DNA-directed DNA polymerase [Tanacetum coccineum]